MFRVADLRKKIVFTLFIIAIYRLGSHIPVPYVDFKSIKALQKTAQNGGGIVGFLDVFSGGAITNIACSSRHHAYITASIIMQLLGVVIRSSKSGSKRVRAGRRRSRSGRGTSRSPSRSCSRPDSCSR